MAWMFYRETGIIPLSPADGGVSATPVPTQPMTPQRNSNVQVSARSNQSSRLPSSLHTPSPQGSTPNTPQHPRSYLSPRVGEALPQYTRHFPSPSQPQVLVGQPVEVVQPVEGTRFWVVVVGYSPGVYANEYVIPYLSKFPIN